MWKYAPMNRTVAMVICLSLVATGACSGDGDAEDSPANRQGSFSLLSYNVAGLPEGLSQSNPEANAPIISKMLGDYDVVVTQEDFGFYTDALRADAPQENMSTPHPGPGALNPIERGSAITGDGLNVMSNFRLIPPDLDRVPWTNCGEAAADCLALKGFAKTTLELESDPEKAVGGEGAEGEAGAGVIKAAASPSRSTCIRCTSRPAARTMPYAPRISTCWRAIWRNIRRTGR